ncbi:tryptophanyl-tRNA synthetase [Xylariales sp. PMI_506]|nr:tryptophanyl-tRNA synthetase [Xylariales sp. PMI_506]
MSARISTRCRPSAVARRLRSQLPPSLQSVAQERRFGSSSSLSSPATDGGDGTKKHQGPAVVFSGIQPTGIPHLGNYLGAMRQWKRLQDDAGPEDKLLFSVVDLHAITMPQDAPALRQRSIELLAALVAIGLDPAKSTMFFQSAVPAHSELMWILSCTSSVGYLSRMTQWKSKLNQKDNQRPLDGDVVVSKLKLGLFSYPVLQAADILIHRATHVPVGEDQRQHLEFARECVSNFNATYPGGNLVAPQTILTEIPRVMSLQNPEKKMSKSSPNNRSRILITQTADAVRAKIRGAVTDTTNSVTYDREARPGVANLLEIWHQCDPARRSPEQLAAELHGAGLGDLKQHVAAAVVAELEGVRARYQEALQRKGGRWLLEIAELGAEKARASAEETMRMVRDVVGLVGR